MKKFLLALLAATSVQAAPQSGIYLDPSDPGEGWSVQFNADQSRVLIIGHIFSDSGDGTSAWIYSQLDLIKTAQWATQYAGEVYTCEWFKPQPERCFAPYPYKMIVSFTSDTHLDMAFGLRYVSANQMINF